MQVEPVGHVEESTNPTSGRTIESLPVPESPGPPELLPLPEPLPDPLSPPELLLDVLPELLPDPLLPSTVTSGPNASFPAAPSGDAAHVAVSLQSFDPQPATQIPPQTRLATSSQRI